MLRFLSLRTRRATTLLTAVSVLAVGSFATSCGGATNVAAKPMSLVEFLIVDQALQPAAPTGSENVPRNALYLMVFSELVNPATVNFQTIQVRTGPAFQSIPGGSFRVTGDRVVYDPTIEADGTPRPFGLAPVQQHSIDIPNIEEQDGVSRELGLRPEPEHVLHRVHDLGRLPTRIGAAGVRAALLGTGRRGTDRKHPGQRRLGVRVLRSDGPVLVHSRRRRWSGPVHVDRRAVHPGCGKRGGGHQRTAHSGHLHA